MTYENPGMFERFLLHNRFRVEQLTRARKTGWLFRLSAKYRALYRSCRKEQSPQEENAALAEVLNAYEESFIWRVTVWLKCAREDAALFWRQRGRRQVIDRADRRRKDYYCVAVIIKNEARYMREFILFHLATGADRIYVYDNGSTDSLMEVLRPFLQDGTAVYRRWDGHTVQAAAYRDAVRRTRRRTKWLALIDADEFLFSPRGDMPGQLRAFEQYPGVGVNWVIFGPNGHVDRPQGLVTDAYTAAHADHSYGSNCHIKSIVQPRRVFTVFHAHYAIYKRKQFAVGEDGTPLDNRTTRAFSAKNNRAVFRINHYCTKSLEELREKCAKGRADGSPNADYEGLLRQFDEPLEEDFTIRSYAELVRRRYEEC